MILLTLLITTLIARKKAKSNSANVLAVSLQSISNDDKTKTPLDKYVEWLRNTDTTTLRLSSTKN